jgi:ferric-dicitrate binding protein FerR (iron transport regulator)
LKKTEISNLLQKYIDGTATGAEEAALMQWYRETAYQDAEFPEDEAELEAAMRERLMKTTRPPVKRFPFKRFSIAASVLLVLGLSVFVLKNKLTNSSDNLTAVSKKSNIIPGGNKATLILADGSRLPLDEVANGKVISQKGIQVSKSADGQLTYTVKDHGDMAANSAADSAPLFNTIETPRGGQYKVILPDGSQVWLNASSSLKFPISFASAKERRVELTGEAYFEVTHRPDLPFRVITSKQTVEVLGTHFDISAYADDATTKTTLLQGSVKVSVYDSGNGALLKPGQQSKVNSNIQVSDVNAEEVIAWKNGYFRFDDEKLENIMKSVARWYDVDVVYEQESLKNETFGAVTTRFSTIGTLLDMMQQTGDIKFSVKGKIITVSKK